MTWAFEKIQIAPEIQADEQTNRRVHEATRLLQSVVGKAARRLRVAWTAVEKDQMQLTLTDSTGEVSATFPVEDLIVGFRLRQQLSGLWNDLLDIRIEIQMDRIEHPDDEVAVS